MVVERRYLLSERLARVSKGVKGIDSRYVSEVMVCCWFNSSG